MDKRSQEAAVGVLSRVSAKLRQRGVLRSNFPLTCWAPGWLSPFFDPWFRFPRRAGACGAACGLLVPRPGPPRGAAAEDIRGGGGGLGGGRSPGTRVQAGMSPATWAPPGSTRPSGGQHPSRGRPRRGGGGAHPPRGPASGQGASHPHGRLPPGPPAPLDTSPGGGPASRLELLWSQDPPPAAWAWWMDPDLPGLQGPGGPSTGWVGSPGAWAPPTGSCRATFLLPWGRSLCWPMGQSVASEQRQSGPCVLLCPALAPE